MTAKEKKQALVDAAHLLNKLRIEKSQQGEELDPADEGAFWRFMNSLSKRDRASVIN